MTPLSHDDAASHNEQELVQAAKLDPAAFDALYRKYLTPIYRYLLTQVRDAEDAADLTQQVFLRAMHALPHYPHHGPFAAWLFKIARNLLIDWHHTLHSSISLDQLPERLHPHAGTGCPEGIAVRHEEHDHMRGLLQQLPLDKRELIALHNSGQLTITEIATVLGKTPEAVKKQLTRTLKALREAYYAIDS
jgi:RNA polymerase sigma-70 factor (ECF subfamily)